MRKTMSAAVLYAILLIGAVATLTPLLWTSPFRSSPTAGHFKTQKSRNISMAKSGSKKVSPVVTRSGSI